MTASSPAARRTRRTPRPPTSPRATSPVPLSQTRLLTYTPAQFWRTSVRCPTCSCEGRAVALWGARALGSEKYTVQLDCKHELPREAFIDLLLLTLSLP